MFAAVQNLKHQNNERPGVDVTQFVDNNFSESINFSGMKRPLCLFISAISDRSDTKYKIS